jgi:hypothetical protein
MIKKIVSFWFIFCAPFMCFTDEIHELCRLGGAESVYNLMETPPLIKKVKPVPPGYLHRVRIKGVVIFCIVLNEDGSVESAVVLSGHPLMRGCALEAVKQYIYSPTIINGKARRVQFITTVKI